MHFLVLTLCDTACYLSINLSPTFCRQIILCQISSDCPSRSILHPSPPSSLLLYGSHEWTPATHRLRPMGILVRRLERERRRSWYLFPLFYTCEVIWSWLSPLSLPCHCSSQDGLLYMTPFPSLWWPLLPFLPLGIRWCHSATNCSLCLCYFTVIFLHHSHTYKNNPFISKFPPNYLFLVGTLIDTV